MGENELNKKKPGDLVGKEPGTPHRPSDMGRAASPASADAAQPESSQPEGAVPVTGANTASTVDSVAAFTDAAIEERRKQRASKRRTSIVVAGVIAGLLAIYLGGAAWFSGHFLPNTQIGSYDISGMDAAGTAAMLDEVSDAYTLAVKGEGLDFTVASKETGLRIDSEKVTKKAVDRNNPWAWPLYMVGAESQDLSDVMEVTYDKKGFAKFVGHEVNVLNKTATDPTPANIAYKKKEKGYVVVP